MKTRLHSSRLLAFAVALLSSLGFAPSASAESAFALPYPETFGTVPAATFDTGQHRVGNANLIVEKLEDGRVRILSESGVDGGARTIASAELVPIRNGKQLRIVSQSSRSFDSSGAPLGRLEIDHTRERGRCTAPMGAGGGEPEVRTIALPHRDRVANVPLNLLFDRLVSGDVSKLDFQVLLCKGGPRLMDFQANVFRQEPVGPGAHGLVEVRYAPDLGTVVSFLARAVVPQLSFWFDPSSPMRWLAHRMPLYSDGPEVLVVKQGFPTRLLFD